MHLKTIFCFRAMLIALAGLIVCVVGITVFILTRNPTPEELSASFLQRGGAIYLSFEESDSMAASVHLIGDEFGASQFRALNDALRDAVEELHFLATRISSQTLSDAEPFPNLERLSIAKRRLDQGVVQFIAKHRGLEVLSLRGCEFANSSVLAPLAALENLRSLDLYGVGRHQRCQEPFYWPHDGRVVGSVHETTATQPRNARTCDWSRGASCPLAGT